MDALSQLLMKLERNPALFIGNTDLSSLAQFISGYCFAKSEENNQFNDWLFNGFREYLAHKYSDSEPLSWPGLIIKHEPDGNSTNSFFKLLHNYLDEQKEKLNGNIK